MSDHKVPWPGAWALAKCFAYHDGWLGDRSGYDDIDNWATTATPDELRRIRELAADWDFLTGYAVGYFAVMAIFKLFGGKDDRK